MKSLFTLLFFLLATLLYSQNIQFQYDTSGNRTTGNIITTRSSETTQKKSSSENYTEELSLGEIKVYPNPTKGLLKIQIPNIESKPILYIISIDGKVLSKIQLRNNFENIDITSYQKGTYLFRIINASEEKVWKIIKE
jgi:hypothetical protein